MRSLLIGLGVAAAIWFLLVLALLVMGRRTAARELAALVPNLVGLFRRLIADPRVPRRAKIWLWVAVAWIASPVDPVPEFLPVVGVIDDAIVAALALRALLRRTDPGVVAEHWRGDPATLERLLGRRRRRTPPG